MGRPAGGPSRRPSSRPSSRPAGNELRLSLSAAPIAKDGPATRRAHLLRRLAWPPFWVACGPCAGRASGAPCGRAMRPEVGQVAHFGPAQLEADYATDRLPAQQKPGRGANPIGGRPKLARAPVDKSRSRRSSLRFHGFPLAPAASWPISITQSKQTIRFASHKMKPSRALGPAAGRRRAADCAFAGAAGAGAGKRRGDEMADKIPWLAAMKYGSHLSRHPILAPY